MRVCDISIFQNALNFLNFIFVKGCLRNIYFSVKIFMKFNRNICIYIFTISLCDLERFKNFLKNDRQSIECLFRKFVSIKLFNWDRTRCATKFNQQVWLLDVLIENWTKKVYNHFYVVGEHNTLSTNSISI